jgi:predicted peptidase
MKYLLSLTLFIFNLPVLSQDQSLFEKKLFVSSSNDSLPYRILFPKTYDKSKKYPLILFLHGAGERGNDNESQLVHGSKLFLDSANREKFPAIVIFPQCPLKDYWASVKVERSKTPLELTFDYSSPPTPALRTATLLLDKIIREEKVNTSAIYIMGLSMGGMGTFEAVYRDPKRFAAAVPICGGADTLRYDKRVRKVPFWIFHGDHDAVVDVHHSRRIGAILEDLNVKVKYTEYNGVNHNSWDYAFAEPDLLPWLFSNKR